MPENHFGERVAERYDEDAADLFEPAVVDPVVDFLAELAGEGAALELGIGTGRIALPLARRGVRVRYVVFNTIMNLGTQDRQVACFENVAAHLQPGGRFVVEIMLPELQRLPLGETFLPFDVTPKHLGFDEYDVAHQGLTSHHYYPVEGDYAMFPGRYVWPSELDLMARLAGMTLRERWSGWKREPFTSESTKHVSVWVKR